MVRAIEHRRAAEEYADLHTSDPVEQEVLVTDEVYSTIALCRSQLDALETYNDDVSDDVHEHLEAAADELQDAMNQRVIETVILGDADE